MLTPEQCRAARALLNWSQSDLAAAAKIGMSTISNFEAGRSTMMSANMDAVVRALEGAGLAIIHENGGGEGVRLSKPRKSASSS